jgi:hypothetical protein
MKPFKPGDKAKVMLLLKSLLPEVRILSVRPPWSLAMFQLGKDVENRPRPLKYRGILAIHTSNTWSKEWAPFLERSRHRHQENPGKEFLRRPLQVQHNFYTEAQFGMGRIIGLVEMYDCVKHRKGTWPESFWEMGPYCWKIRNAISFEDPIPCKGQLSPFSPNDILKAKILLQWRRAIDIRAKLQVGG